MMTVRELINILQKEDLDRIVIMSSDGEGNSYSPLYCAWKGSYVSENREVGLEILTEDDKKAGFTEEDVKNGVKALILTPA